MTSTATKKNTPPTPPKSALKRWIWLPVALILILGGVLAQIDLESIKEQLVQRVAKETGLEIEMAGMGFSFSHGIGFQCKKVKVSTPDGNHFSVERLHILTEWAPLLQGELKIKSIALEHPEARLTLPAIPSGLPVGPVTAQNEKTPPQTGLIDSATLESATKKIKNTPLSIEEFIVSDGKITLIQSGSEKQLPVNIEGLFVLKQHAGGQQDVLASDLKVQTGEIIFAGDGVVENFSADDAQIAFNLKSQTFSWAQIKPVLQFLQGSENEIETPLANIDIEKFSLQAKLPLTALTQVKRLQKELNAQVEFTSANALIKMDDQSYRVETLQGEGSLEQGILAHQFSGTAFGSAFNLKGQLPLNQKNPLLKTQINFEGLQAAQLPIPTNKGWHPSEGTLSGDLTLAIPIIEEKSFSKLKVAYNFQAQNLKLQNKNSPPLFFDQLDGNGDIANRHLNYKIKGQSFNGNFHSEGAVNLPASGQPMLNNRVEFADLDLSQLAPATPIKTGTLSGTLQLKGLLPEAENILTGNLKVDTTFKVADLKMSQGQLPLDIPQLSGSASLRQGKLKHDLNATLFGGKLSTQGQFNFQKQKDQTRVTVASKIKLDKINLNWVPQVQTSEWAPSSGTLTGDLQINGPVSFDGTISPALNLKGQLNGEQLVLGKDKGQIGSAKFDFKEGSLKLTQAQVELTQIKLGDKTFKKARGWLQRTPTNIDLKGGQLWPVNGLINLVADLKPESGNYRLKFKGEKLQVEEFLQPHLKGPLKFSGFLTGTLPPPNSGLPGIAKDLSGNIKIALNEGSLPELGVLENLLTVLNPTSVLETSKKGLSYDYLGGDFKILKGVVHSDNLEMKGPQIMLTAKGDANLVDDTVLAQVKAMPLQMLDKTLKAIPLLGQILTGGKKGGIIETYFKVDGKLSKPEFTLQPHKSLTEKPGNILNELLKLGQ